jgi:serine/threonine-protein kinase
MAPEMVVELRADNRSDVFSLGTVFFEMLTRERLFTGNNTTEVLEQVIAGHQPAPASFGASVPEGCMAILHKALQRDPDRRFATAGEMGEACEHLLYDKGYGPTNLTLKQYLAGLFPESFKATSADTAGFPVIEPTLIPIGDSERPRRRPRTGDDTPVSRPRVATVETQTAPRAPGTLAPAPSRRPRR